MPAQQCALTTAPARGLHAQRQILEATSTIRSSTVFCFISCAPLLLLAACDKSPADPKTASDMPAPPPPPPPPPNESAAMTSASAAPAAPPPGAGDPMVKQDPDMKAVTDQLAALNGKPIETLDATEARKQPTPADAVMALLKKQGKSGAPEEVGKVTNRTIPGSAGQLPVRVYVPKTGKAPYPLIVYYHGGGFVIATIDTYDSSARGLANGAEAIVVAVEYRKAPENKFPAAHDDALAAYEWVFKNAASLGGNAKKIALVGESAGGNLAASVSMAARDKKEPMPVYEVLVYPVAGSDMNTPSYIENANAKPLNKAQMAWFTDKYFRTPADGKDKRIDLVNANLMGLPPTTIINADIDPLRSDGELLAMKLNAAKVETDQKTFSGVTHEFFGMGAAVAKAKEAMALAVSKLKVAFAK